MHVGNPPEALATRAEMTATTMRLAPDERRLAFGIEASGPLPDGVHVVFRLRAAPTQI